MKAIAAAGRRNYTRSDARVIEDLCDRLSDADDIDASDIEVRVTNGVAILSGTVPERWMKHRVEDLAEACGGEGCGQQDLRRKRIAIRRAGPAYGRKRIDGCDVENLGDRQQNGGSALMPALAASLLR